VNFNISFAFTASSARGCYHVKDVNALSGHGHSASSIEKQNELRISVARIEVYRGFSEKLFDDYELGGKLTP
jgi:hypothetical protein